MFNKGNMSNMLKQAQQVQKQIENVQNELDDLNINGESGGGMVKAIVNGKMELLNLDLQKEIFEEDETKEDFLTINNAMTKAQEESQSRMNAVTGGMLGGMKIPGL